MVLFGSEPKIEKSSWRQYDRETAVRKSKLFLILVSTLCYLLLNPNFVTAFPSVKWES